MFVHELLKQLQQLIEQSQGEEAPAACLQRPLPNMNHLNGNEKMGMKRWLVSEFNLDD